MREIMKGVANAVGCLRSVGLFLFVAVLGCLAQSAPEAGPAASADAGTPLSPELARRVEVMIRSRSDIPPEYVIAVSGRRKSEIPGYDQISVTFSADGKTSKPTPFLLSTDGKTLAQFNKFDISADPKEKVSGAGRPARGGPESSPVLIVVFDDLECPYCAKMHAQMFPAILDRYKDQVRVVYLDFPLTDIHPWAMRAAVDANCLATGSHVGYWNFVDAVHLRSPEITTEYGTLPAKANDDLDKLAEEEGARQKINASDLAACLKKQDDTQIKASMKLGDSLGLSGTPATYINGEKLDGAVSMEYVYRFIDGALTAAGQTPPPPFKPAPAAMPMSAAKPGN